jgi:hypothetical protein
MDTKAGLSNGVAERSLLESLKEDAREVQRALGRYASDAAAAKTSALPFAKKGAAGDASTSSSRPSSAVGGGRATAAGVGGGSAHPPSSPHRAFSLGTSSSSAAAGMPLPTRPGTAAAAAAAAGNGTPTAAPSAAQLREVGLHNLNPVHP